MKAITIHINPFKLTEILDCIINKHVNEHMTSYISGYSADNEIIKKIKPDTEVSIEVIDEDESVYCIFRGTISGLTIEEMGNLTKLEIRAKSKTSILDDELHDRLFCNRDQNYKDIVKYLVSANQNTSVIHAKGSKESCNIVTQYRETDWKFLKRLASQLNDVLVPDCSNSKACFYFGFPDKKQMELDVVSYKFCDVNDIQEYVVESRDIMELCVPVVIKDHKLYVYAIESRLSGSELLHKYYLRTRQGFIVPRLDNEKIIGASLLGTVSDVKKEKVKFDCACRCEVNNYGTIWFPYATMYSSPDGTGWYCMPDKGDRIRLYFPDCMENNSYAISAVHIECQENLRKNPEEKSLRTKYDKEIRLTPNKIMITNNKGLSIVLDDEMGISIKSDGQVKIAAEEGIDIECGGETNIAAKRGIIFKENHNSLVIADGIRHTGLTIEYQ